MATRKGLQRRLAAARRALRSSTEESAPSPAVPEVPAISGGGDWWELFPFTAHRIELGPGLHTAPDGTDATTDLRTDVVVAHAGGSLDGLTVVDLGCLEGAFTLEFARLGAAHVVGIEARELNARRCRVAASLLGVSNVSFRVDDVNRAVADAAEQYDIVFASGIVYHLADPAEFLRNARTCCRRFALIDTHVADPAAPFTNCSPDIVEHVSGGQVYRGRTFWEFDDSSTEADRSQMLWAAWDNPQSFWPLEEDLVRMMLDAGFTHAEKIDTSHAFDRWRVDPRSRVMYVCTV